MTPTPGRFCDYHSQVEDRRMPTRVSLPPSRLTFAVGRGCGWQPPSPPRLVSPKYAVADGGGIGTSHRFSCRESGAERVPAFEWVARNHRNLVCLSQALGKPFCGDRASVKTE